MYPHYTHTHTHTHTQHAHAKTLTYTSTQITHAQAGGFGWVDDEQMLLPEHERAANALQGAHAQYVRVPLADSTCVEVGAVTFSAVTEGVVSIMKLSSHTRQDMKY